jgi:hypothetical protein
MAVAFYAVRVKSDRAAFARSMNNCTASFCVSAEMSLVEPTAGTGRGRT